ncbi:MAG: LytTR family DNA-binding domain-containing protein [Mucilaginibacter sp.]
MKKINCIIADDEALAREIIESHAKKISGLNIIATCTNGADVFNSLKSSPVDLLFLDIQMPYLTGIELLRTLKNPPPVIITTAYREFALEGYQLNVIDYLLKPISFERFLKAIDKYQRWTNTDDKGVNPAPIQEIKTGDNAFIYIKCDKKMLKVMLKDILYIEGLKDYVKIHATDKSIVTYQTLTYFEETLPADSFMRVHRSYIISLTHIDAYSSAQIEIGKAAIPIGNTFAREVTRKLQG